MNPNESKGGHGAFLGLAAVILGGLLFAAGVMVGRHLALQEEPASSDPFQRVDKRDRESLPRLDESALEYPNALEKTDPVAPIQSKPTKPKNTTIAKSSAAQEEAKPVASTDGGVDGGNSDRANGPTYAIQAAAFKERLPAERLLEKLKAHGFSNVRIIEEAGDGTSIYRVRLGNFHEKEAAEELSTKLLKEEKLKVLVVKEE